MNFLAHIYLSGDDCEIAIGNFISDSVRGNKYKSFPLGIQRGILLHRDIDTFTDAHEIFRKSTKRLHKKYSHYSGVIVDIFYDHFLAKNWKDYSDESLEEFTGKFYEILIEKYDILPERIQNLIPYLIKDNWLLSYATVEGISKVLNGMSRRTKFKSNMEMASEDLREFYDIFEKEFKAFFEELIKFSNAKLKELNLNL
jgi:acyl carrier protein phosphodiesterase